MLTYFKDRAWTSEVTISQMIKTSSWSVCPRHHLPSAAPASPLTRVSELPLLFKNYLGCLSSSCLPSSPPGWGCCSAWTSGTASPSQRSISTSATWRVSSRRAGRSYPAPCGSAAAGLWSWHPSQWSERAESWSFLKSAKKNNVPVLWSPRAEVPSAPTAGTTTPLGIWGGTDRMPWSLLPWTLGAYQPARADHAWDFLHTCMRECHWDTHPPLVVGSCSTQPRKGLWDKAESYMQDMRPTKRWVLTHFGESVLDLTPGKTLLWDCQEVAGARGLMKMPWREKWNKLDAKNLRQDFSALAHGTKTGFECYVDISLAKWASGISYHCYRWKHKNFWFSGIYPNNLFKIPVLKKPDRTKLHLTFPPCRDTSCWQAGSLPPPSECELPARCRSWGWASGWSPSCPWERAVEQMRDQLSLLLSPQQHKIIAQK